MTPKTGQYNLGELTCYNEVKLLTTKNQQRDKNGKKIEYTFESVKVQGCTRSTIKII